MYNTPLSYLYCRQFVSSASLLLEKAAASVATTAEVMGRGYDRGVAMDDDVQNTYIFSEESPPSSASTLPALAAIIADCADAQLPASLSGARLHWSSRVAEDDEAWQTCQRPDEVDLSLYLRIDREGGKQPESVWQVRQPSPSKGSGRMWRRWVHSRSTMTYAHLKALEEQRFLVTRNTDVLRGDLSEEIIWIYARLDLVDVILELRLTSSDMTQALPPFYKETLKGVREQMHAVPRGSLLFGSLSLLQVIILSVVSSVLKLKNDVEILRVERSAVSRSDAVGEALVRGLKGLMGPKSGDGGTLKSSLEAILCELCRLPAVVEIKAECTDTSENALLFKSCARRDRVEVKELAPTVTGSSILTYESPAPTTFQNDDVDVGEIPIYGLDREEYLLDYRDIKGNLTVVYSKSEGDSRILELFSRYKLFEVMAKVLSRRVYELNKSRKMRVSLKRKSEEQIALT